MEITKKGHSEQAYTKSDKKNEEVFKEAQRHPPLEAQPEERGCGPPQAEGLWAPEMVFLDRPKVELWPQ